MNFAEIVQFTISRLEALNIKYAIVGSVASGFWGDPRATRDVDIVVDLQAKQIDAFCKSFPEDDFYVSRSAVQEAVSLCRPFNVIHNTSAYKIDFMIVEPGSWGKDQLLRSVMVEIVPNVRGNVAAPEDVIIGKLIYYREGGSDKHLRDIASILKVSESNVDQEYLSQQFEKTKLTDLWQAVLEKISDASN